MADVPDPVRQRLIAEAVAAGRVTVVPRGASGPPGNGGTGGWRQQRRGGQALKQPRRAEAIKAAKRRELAAIGHVGFAPAPKAQPAPASRERPRCRRSQTAGRSAWPSGARRAAPADVSRTLREIAGETGVPVALRKAARKYGPTARPANNPDRRRARLADL